MEALAAEQITHRATNLCSALKRRRLVAFPSVKAAEFAALQRLRPYRARPEFAKRLECGVFRRCRFPTGVTDGFNRILLLEVS
jgi:hypothetical protein